MTKRKLSQEHREKLSQAASIRWERERELEKTDIIEQVEVVQYDANMNDEEFQALLQEFAKKGYKLHHIVESKRFIIFNKKNEVITK